MFQGAKMELPLDVKVKALNKKLRESDVSAQLESLGASAPHQIAAIQSLAVKIRGTELEGLPFTIAMMRAKLLPDKAIAEELGIPLKAVRKYSQVDGFQTLLTQMMPCIWSDLILAAQACLMHHISVEKNLNAAQWLLESLGQVASSKPLTNHTHQTLVLNGGTPLTGPNGAIASGDAPSLTVENLAEAMFKRLTDNQKQSGGSAPPVRLSHD